MPKAIVLIAACVLSIWFVLPDIGGRDYTWAGILIGLVALFVVAYKLNQEHAAYPVIGGFAMIIGVLAGIFWPAALLAVVMWLSASARDGTASRKAANASEASGTRIEDA